jgi:AraC-like DNA-binding protein
MGDDLGSVNRSDDEERDGRDSAPASPSEVGERPVAESALPMPLGVFSMMPIVPWARYDYPPIGISDLVERVGIVHFDQAVMSEVSIYRLPECRGDLLFLRRRSAPAWTKLILIGAHDVYAADPLDGAESCVLIWFYPGAMGWASGCPAWTMRNVIAPLESVWGEAGAALHRQLAQLDDDEDVLTAMIEAVSARPRGKWSPLCHDLLIALEQQIGTSRVDSLVQSSGYGDRQLRRLFDAQVGIAPKLALRIIRVRAIIASLRHEQNPKWSDLAATLGYADQAHLSTDVRWFTGMTPKQLIRNRHLGVIVTHEVIIMPRTGSVAQCGYRLDRGTMADRPRKRHSAP